MIRIRGNVKNITGAGFRLIWANKKVVALIEGTEKTITSTAAFREVDEFVNKQAALDRITELVLEYEPPNDIDGKKGDKQ